MIPPDARLQEMSLPEFIARLERDARQVIFEIHPETEPGIVSRVLFEAARRLVSLSARIAELEAERDMLQTQLNARRAMFDDAVERGRADGVTVWPAPEAHGPVSERVMRHYYGASGYVPPDTEREP